MKQETRGRRNMFETIDLAAEFEGLSQEDRFQRYRELWHRAGKYSIQTSYPLHLDIELSGVCNLKCENCFQNELINTPLGLMDVELFRQIITDGVPKGLCAIKLQIRGESFLHPRLFDCIRFAKDQGVLDVQITTNATRLDREAGESLLESGLDAVIFSVDSHHAATSGPSDYFQSTETKINDFLALRKKRRSSRPWVRIQSSIPETDRNSFQEAKDYIERAFPLADIHVVNRIYNFRCDQAAFPDLYEQYNLHPCSYLMQRLAVFWNGEVTVCCSDYNNLFQFGRFPEDSIESIWQSERLRSFRERHARGQRKRVKICRNCQTDISPKENSRYIMDSTKGHLSDQTHE